MTSFAPRQSKKKLRKNMSASTKHVQLTGLETTLHNENIYKFITHTWRARFSGGMWTKIKPK